MMKMSSLCLLLLLLIATQTCTMYRFSDAAKRRIHISDDLDDVVDDEEDEAWRDWGNNKKKPDFDPPPTDFNKLSLSEIQDEMMKRQFGPVFGFVKLRPGTGRSKDIVSEIAMKWTNVARTGAIEAKFMGVDLSTIMFTMEKGQDTIELKEFLLSQSEAYEIKIGDQLFRRGGDPPFEEIVEKIRAEKSKSDDAGSKKDERNDEL
ncbi:Mesoderm development candidate 2 [Forsythia ovata]|uniref:Mesoderm development candidate 2 n=1 Tax=Forsythia ovata TaxID=205694 RepID=A0ABD1PYN8_9LAMI